jgi:hypothetical protein
VLVTIAPMLSAGNIRPELARKQTNRGLVLSELRGPRARSNGSNCIVTELTLTAQIRGTRLHIGTLFIAGRLVAELGAR